MAKLGKDDLKQAEDTLENREELAGLAKTTKPVSSAPKTLSLADIYVAREAFQWRSAHYGALQKQEHTLELARALNDGRRFPPLTVYRIGERFYVLDGHHRLDAYHTVGWTKPVPVQVFDGAFDDAWTYALEANSSTKLPMNREEKSEAAWKLVKTTARTPEQINALSGISLRTVWTMRGVWRRLCAYIETPEGRPAFGKHISDIEGMRSRLSWPKARMVDQGATLSAADEDWRSHKANELAEAIVKHIGGSKFLKYPDITADALRRLDPDLPRALISAWSGEERELIQEIASQKDIEF